MQLEVANAELRQKLGSMQELEKEVTHLRQVSLPAFLHLIIVSFCSHQIVWWFQASIGYCAAVIAWLCWLQEASKGLGCQIPDKGHLGLRQWSMTHKTMLV